MRAAVRDNNCAWLAWHTRALQMQAHVPRLHFWLFDLGRATRIEATVNWTKPHGRFPPHVVRSCVVKASGNCFVNSKLSRPQETNPPDARLDFARQLKATRTAKGFAHARYFAAALGLEENRYTRYERAEVEPSLSIIRRMCVTLGVTPNDLLAPSDGAEPAGPAIGRRENLAWRLASELATVRAGATQPQEATKSLPVLHAAATLYRKLTEDPYSTVAEIASTEVMASIEDEHRKEAIVHLVQAYIDSVRRLDC